jgi:hypothetical protein
MKWRRNGEAYDFRELGSLEFTRLYLELLAREAGFVTTEWREHSFGQAALSEAPIRLSDRIPLQPPTLVVIAWIGDAYLRTGHKREMPLGAARGAWPATKAQSVLILTNARADALKADDGVETILLDEARPELGEGSEQDVDLVQRVLDLQLGVKLELEADPLRTVRDFEDDPRLRVDVPAALVTEEIALGDLAAGGVLDVGDNIRAAVEARKVEEPAHVDARLIGIRHRLSLPSGLGLGRARAFTSCRRSQTPYEAGSYVTPKTRMRDATGVSRTD